MVDVSSGRKVRKQFLPALNRPKKNFFNTTLEDVYREKYGGGTGEMTSRYPRLGENVGVAIGSGLKALGVPKYRAEDVGRRITSLATDWTPFGMLTSAEELPKAVERGDIAGTGLAALGMIPMVGGKAKKAAKVAKAVEEILPEPGGLLARTTTHPISKVKLTTPIEEMEKTTVPFGKMREEKLLHPEWLLGKTVVPMRGDPAAAGQTLLGLGGRKFETPVDLWGGEGYARMEENIKKGLGWASQPGAAATQANRAAEIFKETGKPVVGVYQKMGERSTAFNTMLADALHQMYKLDRSKIAQADVDEFDRIMREVPIGMNKKTGKADLPAYPDWPGLDNLTPEYIRKGAGPKGDGKVRNKMFSMMDSKRWQDRGFPNTGYANWATTDPKLLNRPTHTFGGTTVTYDPQGRTVDPSGHPTYARGIVAKEEGVLPNIPLDVMDPNYRLTGGTGGGPISNSQLEKFLMTKPPLIKVDDQTLDRIMKYLRSQEGFNWGLGGAVTAGIISEEQAREITQAQGTGAQQ